MVGPDGPDALAVITVAVIPGGIDEFSVSPGPGDYSFA